MCNRPDNNPPGYPGPNPNVPQVQMDAFDSSDFSTPTYHRPSPGRTPFQHQPPNLEIRGARGVSRDERGGRRGRGGRGERGRGGGGGGERGRGERGRGERGRGESGRGGDRGRGERGRGER